MLQFKYGTIAADRKAEANVSYLLARSAIKTALVHGDAFFSTLHSRLCLRNTDAVPVCRSVADLEFVGDALCHLVIDMARSESGPGPYARSSISERMNLFYNTCRGTAAGAPLHRHMADLALRPRPRSRSRSRPQLIHASQPPAAAEVVASTKESVEACLDDDDDDAVTIPYVDPDSGSETEEGTDNKAVLTDLDWFTLVMFLFDVSVFEGDMPDVSPFSACLEKLTWHALSLVPPRMLEKVLILRLYTSDHKTHPQTTSLASARMALSTSTQHTSCRYVELMGYQCRLFSLWKLKGFSACFGEVERVYHSEERGGALLVKALELRHTAHARREVLAVRDREAEEERLRGVIAGLRAAAAATAVTNAAAAAAAASAATFNVIIAPHLARMLVNQALADDAICHVSRLRIREVTHVFVGRCGHFVALDPATFPHPNTNNCGIMPCGSMRFIRIAVNPFEDEDVIFMPGPEA